MSSGARLNYVFYHCSHLLLRRRIGGMASRPQARSRFQRFAEVIEKCLLESRLACVGFCDRNRAAKSVLKPVRAGGRCKCALQWFRSEVSPVDGSRGQTSAFRPAVRRGSWRDFNEPPAVVLPRMGLIDLGPGSRDQREQLAAGLLVSVLPFPDDARTWIALGTYYARSPLPDGCGVLEWKCATKNGSPALTPSATTLSQQLARPAPCGVSPGGRRGGAGA
jgi:hypothetical protein